MKKTIENRHEHHAIRKKIFDNDILPIPKSKVILTL